jgi:hypothetical protein
MVWYLSTGTPLPVPLLYITMQFLPHSKNSFILTFNLQQHFKTVLAMDHFLSSKLPSYDHHGAVFLEKMSHPIVNKLPVFYTTQDSLTCSQ